MELRAFLLRPDIGPGGAQPRRRDPNEKPGDLLTGHLGDMAREAGKIMRRTPKTSYSVPALEATEYAKQVGRVDPFHTNMLKAYWEDGLDIELPEVIHKVADESGVDWPGIEKALRERTYQEAVENQMEEAVQMGINAIPAFIMYNRGFLGAQPYDTFLKLLDITVQEQGLTVEQ
jgi:predicted DsbA family dithiol-disulfide isomerase